MRPSQKKKCACALARCPSPWASSGSHVTGPATAPGAGVFPAFPGPRRRKIGSGHCAARLERVWWATAWLVLPWASKRRRKMKELNKIPNFCRNVQSASHLFISLSHFLDGQDQPQSPKKNFQVAGHGPFLCPAGRPTTTERITGCVGNPATHLSPLHRKQPAPSRDTSLS